MPVSQNGEDNRNNHYNYNGKHLLSPYHEPGTVLSTLQVLTH